MNERFRKHVEVLDPILQRLVGMPPARFGRLPKVVPPSGVYLFSEGGTHLYVGRSKRLRNRLQYHATDRWLSASFAFLLAREATGRTKATYKKAGSRKELQSDPQFRQAFRDARARISEMDVRFVEEPDPVRQALLEIYAAISLETKYNKFETT